jgi:hypothetical protein
VYPITSRSQANRIIGIKYTTGQIAPIKEQKIHCKKPKQTLDWSPLQQPSSFLDTTAEEFVSHPANGRSGKHVVPRPHPVLARPGVHPPEYSSPYSSNALGSTSASSSFATAGPSSSYCSFVLDAKTMVEVAPKRNKRKLEEAERKEIRENRGSTCDYRRRHQKKVLQIDISLFLKAASRTANSRP